MKKRKIAYIIVILIMLAIALVIFAINKQSTNNEKLKNIKVHVQYFIHHNMLQ